MSNIFHGRWPSCPAKFEETCSRTLRWITLLPKIAGGDVMKIACLERTSLGEHVDLRALNTLGEVMYYDATSEEEMAQRVQDADILVINKLKINEKTLGPAPRLKFITITATGTDNFDLPFCKSRNIVVSNMRGYSTQSVAQQTFAIALMLMNQMEYFVPFVRSGAYIGNTTGEYYQTPIHEISGKTWGIVGLGKIGTKVADIASAFGAEVIYCSLSGHSRSEIYERMDFDTLLARSDIVSVHAPLTEESRGIFNYRAFQKMKPDALFLNLGRGKIVVEKDLARAILENQIAGAGLDVLDGEPMREDSPLVPLLQDRRLVVTPHVGWASEESRQRAVDEVVRNIQAFLAGSPRNRCW